MRMRTNSICGYWYEVNIGRLTLSWLAPSRTPGCDGCMDPGPYAVWMLGKNAGPLGRWWITWWKS